MRDLNPKRIVVKIGTNTICKEDGTVDHDYLDGIARQIVELDKKGIQTIMVTSGAIGSGSSELGLDGKNKDLAMKQACAAVGQATLMMAWRDAFRKYGKCVGQVLLTYGAFSERARYLNLKKAMDELFRLDAIPIVNENDVIATDEIAEGFGDNDKLSALVASKMDADLLILLTDVDGLFDRNPDADKDAKLISMVDEITKDIERIAGSKKDERSVGGMRTKIGAAKVAMASGCNMVIANGKLDNVIIASGRGRGDRDALHRQGALYQQGALDPLRRAEGQDHGGRRGGEGAPRRQVSAALWRSRGRGQVQGGRGGAPRQQCQGHNQFLLVRDASPNAEVQGGEGERQWQGNERQGRGQQREHNNYSITELHNLRQFA